MAMKLNLVRPKEGIVLPSSFGRLTDVFSVCFVDSKTLSVGITNYSQYLGYETGDKTFEHKSRSSQPNKPKLFKRNEFESMFERVVEDDFPLSLRLPSFLTMTDEEITSKYDENWLKRRDTSYGLIEPLIPATRSELEYFVYRYLAGEMFEEIKLHCQRIEMHSTTSITRRINSFIVFGLIKNALLPFGFQHCGSNYKHFDGDKVNKRGRKSIYTEYRGVTLEDKTLIKRIAKESKVANRGGILDKGLLYQNFLVRLGEDKGYPEPTIAHSGQYQFQYPQSWRISEETFRYHLKQLIGLDDWLKLRDGHHTFNKDHKPKTGDSRDGVLGAGHTVEFDHTELDMHVRLPGVHDKRYSAGRLYLCIAIDVYTKYVLGFSLSFRAPCWENVAECIINCVRNKQELAAEFGVTITSDDWYAFHMHIRYMIDNGKEYPKDREDEFMVSQFNFEASARASKGRGDQKATSERGLGSIIRKIAKNPGGIEKGRSAMEQDPSQQALLTYEDVGAQIIDEILLHNKTANREYLLDQDMLLAGIDNSPQSQWRYSLEHQMSGGNPVPESDIPSLRYTLLNKTTANIQKDGITLSKYPDLQYDADFGPAHDWYMQKKHNQSNRQISIQVAYTDGCVDHVYYKTEDGVIIPFALKSQCSQFEGMSFFEYEQIKKSRKNHQIAQKEQRLAGKVYNRTRQTKRIKANENTLRSVPKNTQTAYQTKTSEHNAVMRQQQLAADAQKSHNQLAPDFPRDGAYESTGETVETTTSPEEFY